MPALLVALAPLDVDVVADPAPEDGRNPWRTYRAALERTPAWADARLILQDDVELCPHFPEAALAALAVQPDRVVAFFTAGSPSDNAQAMKRAAWAGVSWAPLRTRRWCPTVALAWPVRLIQPFLDYVDRQTWPRAFVADDEMAGRFLRSVAEVPLATVPSLVQHHDRLPSVMGRTAGRGSKSRIAPLYAGDRDAREIDWTLGPELPRPVR